ncbi:hypothetical protein DMC61_04805 [Amycolatopsis sp. WAC 04169]|nr:hypothetical protein DMC61_04805 [Amycolatopsis sp. WAC 04169]
MILGAVLLSLLAGCAESVETLRGHVRLRIVPEHERGIKDWDRRKAVSDLDVGKALAVMDFVMATHFRGPR